MPLHRFFNHTLSQIILALHFIQLGVLVLPWNIEIIWLIVVIATFLWFEQCRRCSILVLLLLVVILIDRGVAAIVLHLFSAI